MKELEIDIISDVVCPWCVIGFSRLQKAIEQLSNQIDVKINWHPFELNPSMSDTGENLRAHLAKKYGTTLEGSIKARKMLTDLGQDVDFKFNYFDEMKMLNTHQCHQLLLWAKGSGKQTQLAMALFELFFTNKSEFTQEKLLEVVTVLGLNEKEAEHILQTNLLSPDVKRIENQWRQQGIQAVPAFIFNKQEVLLGAQEVETFFTAINSSMQDKE